MGNNYTIENGFEKHNNNQTDRETPHQEKHNSCIPNRCIQQYKHNLSLQNRKEIPFYLGKTSQILIELCVCVCVYVCKCCKTGNPKSNSFSIDNGG